MVSKKAFKKTVWHQTVRLKNVTDYYVFEQGSIAG